MEILLHPACFLTMGLNPRVRTKETCATGLTKRVLAIIKLIVLKYNNHAPLPGYLFRAKNLDFVVKGDG